MSFNKQKLQKLALIDPKLAIIGALTEIEKNSKIFDISKETKAEVENLVTTYLEQSEKYLSVNENLVKSLESLQIYIKNNDLYLYFDGVERNLGNVVGKNGENPSKKELKELILELIPSVKNGEDGKTPKYGVDYFTEQEKQDFIQEILSNIPEHTYEKEEIDGKSIADLLEDLKGDDRLDYNALKNKPEQQKFYGGGGGTKLLGNLLDVDTSQLSKNPEGKFILGTGGGGGIFEQGIPYEDQSYLYVVFWSDPLWEVERTDRNTFANDQIFSPTQPTSLLEIQNLFN